MTLRWRRESRANPSLNPNSLLAGKIQGISGIMAQAPPRQLGNGVAKLPHKKEVGQVRRRAVSALCRIVRIWAGVAFIVSCIMPSVLAGARPLARSSGQWYSSGNSNFGTKFGSASWSSGERIIVICPSPHENTTMTSLRSVQFCAADREVEGSHPRFGGDKRSSWLPLIQIWEIETFWNVGVENFHAAMINHISCWRISCVLKY